PNLRAKGPCREVPTLIGLAGVLSSAPARRDHPQPSHVRVDGIMASWSRVPRRLRQLLKCGYLALAAGGEGRVVDLGNLRAPGDRAHGQQPAASPRPPPTEFRAGESSQTAKQSDATSGAMAFAQRSPKRRHADCR